MNNDYSKLTQEHYDEILLDIISKLSASDIIIIPGAYEVFSEYFNNEVLKQFENE